MPKGIYDRPSEETRFWSKVDIKGEDDCWFWLGSKDPDGYGYFTLEKGKTIGAHRYSLMKKLNCDLTTSAFACHSCDYKYSKGDTSYRLCVNPKHLEKGDANSNSSHMKLLNRQAKGEDNSQSVLTTEQAKEILQLYKEAKQNNMMYGFNLRMSKKYNVDKQVICRLTSGKTWKHLHDEN